jgi:hypothetical protein
LIDTPTTFAAGPKAAFIASPSVGARSRCALDARRLSEKQEALLSSTHPTMSASAPIHSLATIP